MKARRSAEAPMSMRSEARFFWFEIALLESFRCCLLEGGRKGGKKSSRRSFA